MLKYQKNSLSYFFDLKLSFQFISLFQVYLFNDTQLPIIDIMSTKINLKKKSTQILHVSLTSCNINKLDI